MIALAAVACAAAVHAASFNWSTTNKFTDNEGTVITTADGYTSALNGGSIVLVLLSDATDTPTLVGARVLAASVVPGIVSR